MKFFTKGKAIIKLTLFLLLFSWLNSAFSTELKESITGKPVDDATITAGKQLFESKCMSCHSLNNKLVGPALKDVQKRRSYDWLLNWIKDNESLRKSGDKDAIAIFEEYNKLPMQSFKDLKDDEIASIIMFIENAGVTNAAATPGKTTESTEPVKVDKSTSNKINWLIFILVIVLLAIIILLINITDRVNELGGKEIVRWDRINAFLLIAILILGMGAAFWEFFVHGKLIMSEPASEYGRKTDRMFYITLLLTGIVFVITEILLFWFAFKYRKRKGTKAYYYPHNNKLEVIWTLIPAVVLTSLVISGLVTWRKITNNPERDKFNIEIFGYQFGWTARYPGNDGKLGNSNWNLISNDNLLGVAIKSKATQLIPELENEVTDLEKELNALPNKLEELKAEMGGLTGEDLKLKQSKIDEIECGVAASELSKKIKNRKIQIQRIKKSLTNKNADEFYNTAANDDIIVNNEIHLPVNKTITLKFRGRDVIHSAYMYYFRTQINVVPGLPTEIVFKPIVTTNEQRKKLNKPDFDYYLICAKICGTGHFNMKLKIVVDTEEDYNKWIKSQPASFADIIQNSNNKNINSLTFTN
ncbi:MAG: c-type cytochrome [Bacteroidetes bacterium]|nr:c-type cytochrome [Bacteroidota bacterium]